MVVSKINEGALKTVETMPSRGRWRGVAGYQSSPKGKIIEPFQDIVDLIGVFPIIPIQSTDITKTNNIVNFDYGFFLYFSKDF